MIWLMVFALLAVAAITIAGLLTDPRVGLLVGVGAISIVCLRVLFRPRN